MRVRLLLDYDGTNYHGFQIQENAASIQEELERAIEAAGGGVCRVDGAGRTDAGVHALGQVAAFTTSASIPGKRWAQILNHYLPPDIHVQESSEEDGSYHPRFLPHTKTYLYQIFCGQRGKGIHQRYASCIRFPLDVEKMQRVCADLRGEHDFRAFCATRSSVRQYVRTVLRCELCAEGEWLRLYIQANGFLYNMVRIIVGTLVDIGRGHLPENTFQEMIRTGKRSLGGKTAPPQGLFLYEVEYLPGKWKQGNTEYREYTEKTVDNPE